MKLPSFLTRRRGAAETKASGFFTLTGEGRAHWSSRSYASLSREGFMKNPVAHRAVRMIAEAAASVPWLAYEGEAERPEDPRLALLARPNGRMAGTDFFETLYGHLLLSGNAFVEGVRLGGELRELHSCGPTGCRSSRGGMDGRSPMNTARARMCAGMRRARGRRSCICGSSIRSTTRWASRRWRRPPWRSTSPMPRPSGTRRCSTIRRGLPARWSTSRRRAVTFRPTSTTG